MILFLLSACLLASDIRVHPEVLHLPPTLPSSDPGSSTYATVWIEYRNEETPILPGGRIQIAFAYHCTDIQTNPNFRANGGYLILPNKSLANSISFDWRLNDERGRNYTTVETKPAVEILTSTPGKSFGGEEVLQIEFPQGLPADSVVRVTYGDTSRGGPGMVLRGVMAHPSILAFEDLENSGNLKLAETEFPRLLITAATADRIHVNLPMTAEIGKEFEFSLQAVKRIDEGPRDRFAHVRLKEDFRGTVLLHCEDPRARIPRLVRFEKEGYRRLRGTFHTPGVQQVRAWILDEGRDDVSGITPQTLSPEERATRSSSNPTLVSGSERTDEHAAQLLCGVLQAHCLEGHHASRTQKELHHHLLEECRHDFTCVVQHITEATADQHLAKEAVRQFQERHDPQGKRYVPFYGYEWTLDGGHRNIIFREIPDHPGFRDSKYKGASERKPILVNDVDDLLSELAALPEESITIIHHSQWLDTINPGPFQWGDPGRPATHLQLFEMYSRQGSSDRYFPDLLSRASRYVMRNIFSTQQPPANRASYRAAIGDGFRFGVIAGTDFHSYAQHDGRGPAANGYGRGGLTVVCADPSIPVLKDRIWDALRKRRCYGTTGARIHLDFRFRHGEELHPLGSEVPAGEGRFEIRAIAAGLGRRNSAGIDRVDLIRNENELLLKRTWNPPQSTVDLTWDEIAPPERSWSSYRVILYQDDDHMLWSSPIWLLRDP